MNKKITEDNEGKLFDRVWDVLSQHAIDEFKLGPISNDKSSYTVDVPSDIYTKPNFQDEFAHGLEKRILGIETEYKCSMDDPSIPYLEIRRITKENHEGKDDYESCKIYFKKQTCED